MTRAYPSTKMFLLVFKVVCLFIPSATAFIISFEGRRQLQHGVVGLNLAPLPENTSSLDDACDVAVMGGGFGGLYTALAISRQAKKYNRNVDIVLVDNRDRFVFLPLLYDLTMGTASEAEVCPTYDELLEGTGIRYIKASFDSFIRDDTGSLLLVKEDEDNSIINLSSKASVVAVGATPELFLNSIPGASEYAIPFYTREDAFTVRELLFRMDQKARQGHFPKIAIIGGGYGGVELAACVSRRLPKANVTLISRGPPMSGTRAESMVNIALETLGVITEISNVRTLKQNNSNGRITIDRTTDLDLDRASTEVEIVDTKGEEFDAVLWTAGSFPSQPLTENSKMGGLALSSSNRLVVDKTLRCSFDTDGDKMPPVWALGDCCEILPVVHPTPPKTAQVAIQQADVVASNVLDTIFDLNRNTEVFEFQDLGSMLTLGGPNGAIIGPKDGAQLESLLVPLLDTARVGLGVADNLLTKIINSKEIDKTGAIAPVLENLNLSLGGYGLGISPETSPSGVIAGTLSGASRRAIYALRMPTNKQRAVAGASAFISSAASLVKEASDQIQTTTDKNNIS